MGYSFKACKPTTTPSRMTPVKTCWSLPGGNPRGTPLIPNPRCQRVWFRQGSLAAPGRRGKDQTDYAVVGPARKRYDIPCGLSDYRRLALEYQWQHGHCEGKFEGNLNKINSKDLSIIGLKALVRGSIIPQRLEAFPRHSQEPPSPDGTQMGHL